MPRVSVVIPAYEPGDFLRGAIDSVLEQTVRDIEVVVVDDGSTQDLSWVEVHPDDRVRYVRQRNGGVSVARNVGALVAGADLVAFLDQDDRWEPDKLALQLAALADEPEAAFCCTEFTWVSSTQGAPGRYDAPVTYEGLLRDQHVCLSSVVVSRAKYFEVGGHDPLLSQMQDFDLFLRLSHRFGAPIVIAGSQVRYQLHDGNASADYVTAARERRVLLRAHRQRAMARGDESAASAARAGLARTRDLYSSQALDAFRRDLRMAGWSALPREAFDIVRLRPTLLPRAAIASLGARARERRSH